MQPSEGPGSLGKAFVSVHSDTDPFADETARGIRKATDDADDLLDDIGESWGDTISKSTAKSIEGHGRDFADAVEEGIGRQTITIKGKKFTIDRRGNLHDAAGRFASGFVDEVEEAFIRAGTPGGPFSRIGTGIADAIGAGFNISGRSPLIAVLLPAVGAIVGLVLAAVQAVNSLIAVLVTLPALIASIGLQVGVLMIAFNGVGDAVKGAFAAKNAKELQEAIKGLTPSAQTFVKSLLPLKPLFAQIQKVTQSNFFKALGTPIKSLVDTFGPTFVNGFARLATVMGTFFADLAAFFGSPTFVSFVKDVFPATGRWIQNFGPAFIEFLSTLIAMADLALPFLEKLGLYISNNLNMLSRVLQDLLKDGSFFTWLDDMWSTFRALSVVLFNLIGFLATFMAQLNTAGGETLLTAISDAVAQLTFFFGSPVGQKALEDLINISIASIRIITGLIILIGSLLALLEIIGESLKAFFSWLITDAGPAIAKFYTGWLNLQVVIGQSIAIGLAFLGGLIWNIMKGAYNSVVTWFNNAVAWVAGLPGRFLKAIGNLGGLLVNAGRALVRGLTDGIRSMANAPVEAARNIINRITDFLPGSPAKEGPLSGEGYTLLRGRRMGEDFTKGLKQGFDGVDNMLGSDLGAMVKMLAPSTTNNTGINFGPGAVKLTFEGRVPTEDEARTVGSAAGAGLADQLAKRDTRLQVRTL